MSRVKVYKPTTPSRRKTSVIKYNDILTGDKPYKKLMKRVSTTAGRNSRGKITIRHRGGGARKLVRQVNFKREFPQGFKVLTIEYDPTRSAFISLVSDLRTGDKHYVLHTKGMKAGEKYNVSANVGEGDMIALGEAPVGAQVCQIELQPGQGAKIVRSAGNYAQVTAKEDDYVTLKLPSGEIRRFLAACKCVLGRMGNEAHELVRVGRAGRVRNSGRRPQVRGKVMNPVDHPHGGGEARNSIGLKSPKTKWGKIALGVKTRNKKKASGRLIVKRRNKK
jgi:large subunit ribosomal protein L2